MSRNLWFVGPLVVKYRVEHPIETALLADPIFVPSVRLGHYRMMLRGRSARVVEFPDGIRSLVTLWDRPGYPNPGWRDRLVAHLREIYPDERLVDRVSDLPEVDEPRLIHGDPTLANLITLSTGAVRWIDPLYRTWVPGSPLVDRGKLLQSAWNYENVLDGRTICPNRDLVRLALDGLSVSERYHAHTWFYVHVARLLRYHSPEIALAYVDFLERTL